MYSPFSSPAPATAAADGAFSDDENLNSTAIPGVNTLVTPVSLPAYDLLLLSMVSTMQEQEESEAMFFKLELIGFRVGHTLAERMTERIPRFSTTLDVMKFACKEFWFLLFRKQIDNLKTNHRGVFVLQDNNFSWFRRFSTASGEADTARRAIPYLWFPCGLIRGALANLGVSSVVVPETTSLPQCTFQVKITAT